MPIPGNSGPVFLQQCRVPNIVETEILRIAKNNTSCSAIFIESHVEALVTVSYQMHQKHDCFCSFDEGEIKV